MRISGTARAHTSVVLVGVALAGVALAQTAGEDWYPADITPPPGTRYPCALTALPRELPGIPAADRRFVNHSYALILKATQAKLVLLQALEQGDAASELERHRTATRGLVERLQAEPAPAGLEAFKADVLAALALQRTFFEQAQAQRRAGASMEQVYRIAEGRQASARLIAAWAAMQRRYPAWSPETKDSIYHHLCALDLF